MSLSHGNSERSAAAHALWWAFGLNVAFLVVELVGGILTGSLALLSDAGHMVSDVGALAFALLASRIVRRPPSARRTYGYGRAEVVVALLNGLTLWLIVGAILLEAIRRTAHPPAVQAGPMLAVATAGLLANLTSAAVLFRHRGYDLNLRGAFLHLAADSFSSAGVVVAGFLMWRFGWMIADPIASLLIGALILISSWQLVKESLNVLLEGAPSHLDTQQIRSRLEAIEGVDHCHDLHVWVIGSGEPILTAHLTVEADAEGKRVLQEATTILAEQFGIDHVTLQIERETCDHLHRNRDR